CGGGVGGHGGGDKRESGGDCGGVMEAGRRVRESGIRDWIDQLMRSLFGFAEKSPPKKFSGGGVVAGWPTAGGWGGRKKVKFGAGDLLTIQMKLNFSKGEKSLSFEKLDLLMVVGVLHLRRKL
nr:hypothetical protein [Tanacetum cinerariifolium]